MLPELDQKLCEKFPKIFRDRNAPMTETCMCWGLDVNNGWYDLIDMMCTTVQGHINNNRKDRVSAYLYNRVLRQALRGKLEPIELYHSKGRALTDWHRKMIDDAIREKKFRIVPDKCEQVVATQVKEKFGTLRFYYVGGDDYCDGVISFTENMSSIICEDCGNAGRIRNRGWIRTLCDTHAIAAGKMNDDDEDEDQLL